MFRSKIKSEYRKRKNARFYQGDILKDLDFQVGHLKKETEKDKFHLPHSVILNQDCDLQQDFDCRKIKGNQDKYLLSFLVCPAYSLNDFAFGTPLRNWQMRKFYPKEIEKLKNNDEYKRYHFLSKESDFSMPELVIDFKHFFTLPRDFLYKQRKDKYVASLNEIFREELSQRFSNYLSRIRIPELE